MAYDYGELNGPHTWSLRFPAAAGSRQSPVNLNTSRAVYDGSLKGLYIDLKNVSEQKLIMREHNFQVSTGDGGTLSDGPLDSTYHLAQFHFHWGSGNGWGSEHTINGLSSAAELHCVFVNSKYQGLSQALEHPDGLSVVGVLIQVGDRSNSVLEKIANQVKGMKPDEEKILTPMLDLMNLLPGNLAKYYTYSGSLTTPPCSECVTWIVLDEKITLSQAHLDQIRHVHDNCTVCGSTDNFRPLCPVGWRSLRSSFPS